MKAVMIAVDQPPMLKTLDSYDEVVGLVGGHLEQIKLSEEIHGFVDRDGKAKGLPVNHLASVLFREFLRTDDAIVGNVVVFGSLNPTNGLPDGESYDVPAILAALIVQTT